MLPNELYDNRLALVLILVACYLRRITASASRQINGLLSSRVQAHGCTGIKLANLHNMSYAINRALEHSIMYEVFYDWTIGHAIHRR